MKPALAAVGVFCALVVAGCKHDKKEAVAAPLRPQHAAPVAISAPSEWKTVEEFNFFVRPGQAPARFTLQVQEKRNDPGNFTKLCIRMPGLSDFVLENQDGWVAYNNDDNPSAVYADLARKNLVKSRYVLILPGSSVAGEPPVVFLRSWEYGSSPERLHVIGFKPSGEPVTLINRELSLESFKDLDGDGRPEIVGLPCFSQEVGHDVLTYDPHHVYKITQPIAGPVPPSMELSRSYNLKHYYGWAGVDCSEKLSVVLHPPAGGKAVIMDAAEPARLNPRDK